MSKIAATQEPTVTQRALHVEHISMETIKTFADVEAALDRGVPRLDPAIADALANGDEQQATELERGAPLSKTQPLQLERKPILIVSSLRDPIISADKATQLASLLQEYGATVDHRTLPAGHELSQADVVLARSW